MEFSIEHNDKVDDPRAKTAKYIDQTVVRFNKNVFEFARDHFVIDDEYVGDPPKVQVSFENINDNINEKFLSSEISKIGNIRHLEIVRDSSGKHLGLAKVEFDNPAAAGDCVNHYNNRHLMGKKLTVELDVRFEKIERKKEEKLRPSIKPIRQLEPVQNIQAPIPQTFPPTPVLPPIQPDVDKSINRLHAPGTLLERIAKMGLAQQGSFPPIPPPQAYPLQNRNTIAQPQLHQDHKIARLDRKPINVHLPQPQPSFEEDEKLWNPPTSTISEEKLYLTDDQIFNEVLPFIIDEYMRELSRNIEFTTRRKIILTVGYPILDKSQSEYKAEQDRVELEQRRQEQENVNKEREKNAIMLHVRHKTLEKRYLGMDRQDLFQKNRNRAVVIRHRTSDSDMVHGRVPVLDNLKRINRSSALVDESRELDIRRKSFSSDESSVSRQSRSRVRLPFESRSRSGSERSSESSSSRFSASRSSSEEVSSLSSQASSSSSASSRSSSSDGSERESPSFRIQVASREVSSKPARDEVTAASALLDLKGLPNASEKLDSPKVQGKSTKRKIKVTGQENRDIKRHKSIADEVSSQAYDLIQDSLRESKRVSYPERSSRDIAKLENDLTFNDEDLKYLEAAHDSYEQEHSGQERTKIPFGSRMVNEAHLMSKKNSIENEIKSRIHPKWWTGCSRCSLIEISDKGKMEETVYDDSQKALIKSHVIQAANSTRRDQRNDQRRMATLNPAIDPSFLKQFTSNTLQMRAKNLRFSRSKIHKWGLFACEKIANGDAVIEYVGEKIRPSVADHREKIVYTNLPTHDGSSYFFRVDSDVIDATLKGNKARFINHSCNPNCIAKVIKHENGTNSIVIYAKQAIDEDEEITYDYKFPREEDGDKIQCRCKAPNCQKYLN